MDVNFELNLDDFDDLELDTSIQYKNRYIKPPRSKELSEKQLKYSSAKKLAKDLILHPDCRYFIVVNGGFYFGDFIEALIIENNFYVDKMTISTLSMCENNVDSLATLLIKGYVNKLNLIISDYFFSHERSKLIPYIYKELDKENRFQLAVAGTHCKLCIFETDDNRHICIHGSANLRSSSNIEQFVVEESKELYAFNNEYQDRIIKKYKTINHSIRGKNLWQQVAHQQEVEVETDLHQPQEEGKQWPSKIEDAGT